MARKSNLVEIETKTEPKDDIFAGNIGTDKESGEIAGSDKYPDSGSETKKSSTSTRKRKSEKEVFGLDILEDKKKSKDKEKEKPSNTETMVRSFLSGLSAVGSAKFQIPKLDDSEIDMIAEPAGRVLNKYLGTMEGTSDIILLILALVVVVTPRIISLAQNKKQEATEVIKNDVKTTKISEGVNNTDKTNAGLNSNADYFSPISIY